MSYSNLITTSIFGRRFGLQSLTTSQSGSGRPGNIDLLVGAEAVRAGVSTNESTGTNLTAFGVSVLTTAVSSGVYVLDPPIPGVEKTLAFASSAQAASPIYVKSAGGEFFQSSQGSTMSVLSSSQSVAPFAVRLVGLSTSAWAVLGSPSSGSLRASTTT